MRYDHLWQKMLGQDEQIAYVFSLGFRYIFFRLLLSAVISILTIRFYGVGLVFFACALFYYGFYLRIANAYAFTNKRILLHYGWLSTYVISVDFSRITDIEISQRFLDRLLYDTGTIYINTAGSAEHEIVLKNIGSPYRVKQTLIDLMDADEQRSKRNVA